MKKLLMIATLSCLVLASAVTWAQESNVATNVPVKSNRGPTKIDLSISPYISQGFGYTKWIMEVTGYVDTDIIGTVKSELDYPLNSLNGGLELRIGAGPTAYKDWSITLSVGTNFNDPSHVMKDYDWIFVPGYFNGGISYTESKVKMTSLQGALDAQITLARGRIARFGLAGGVRYQHFYQELYDLVGWQLDDSLKQQYFYAYPGSLVGTYKINYTVPSVGLFYRLQCSSIPVAELRAAFAIPFASDVDDHVLRNRRATASGSGLGYTVAIRLVGTLGCDNGSVKPFIELNGELLSIDAKPKQTIYWYGDDPITPEVNDTGTRMPGIPHHVISKQGHITGKIGLTF